MSAFVVVVVAGEFPFECNLPPTTKWMNILSIFIFRRGRIVVIEWKTSDRKKSTINSTFDYPLQMCAYLGALNADARYTIQANGAILVVAYNDGSPAHAFTLSATDLNKYWKCWLLRLQEYWIRKRDRTLLAPI